MCKILAKQKILSLFFFLVLNSSFSQTTLKNGLIHVQIKRLNDSYIDTFYNQPPTAKKLPILLFCQGSGYDSNTEGFLELLAQFEDKAVGLAIEKQGVHFGDEGTSPSEEYLQHNTIYNRVYDYLRVLQYMRINAPWWNGELYVIGGSEGGLLAGILASFYPNTKAVAILSFGGGLNFGEAWPTAVELQKRAEGLSLEAVQNEVALMQDSINVARKNPTYDQFISGIDNTHAWWTSIIDLRLENILIDLNIPIFLGHGTEDLMAPLRSAQRLSDTFRKAGKTNLFYKEYAGYNHAFTNQEKESRLVEVFMEAMEWILNAS